jgi:hypothetical protein
MVNFTDPVMNADIDLESREQKLDFIIINYRFKTTILVSI